MAAGGPLFSFYPAVLKRVCWSGGWEGSPLTMLKAMCYGMAALEEDSLNALTCRACLTYLKWITFLNKGRNLHQRAGLGDHHKASWYQTQLDKIQKETHRKNNHSSFFSNLCGRGLLTKRIFQTAVTFSKHLLIRDEETDKALNSFHLQKRLFNVAYF